MRKKSELKITNFQHAIIKKELSKAIKMVGSQAKFSKVIGSHQTMVSKWLTGVRISSEHVLKIEKEFGIGREILRPDLFLK